MRRTPKHFLIIALSCVFCAASEAADWYDALSQTTASADLRLRYEAVDQDNTLEDADALTFRTQLNITSGEYRGFSFTAELEDVRVALGQGDYSVGPADFHAGIYSTIADPKTTELDQALIQYRNRHITVKAGRQIIALDDHRFVGDVGWRQDRQTFDGVTVAYTINDAVDVFYGYINQRNRIFAEAADINSKDHLFNASYTTAMGKFVAYGYLLEEDNEAENSIDTYGISFTGGVKQGNLKWVYGAEAATQSSENALADYNASYHKVEGGLLMSGITGKLMYEVLGSDEGKYGFSTPLATLHKFNGWTDQFLTTPAQGLEDLAVSVAAPFAGGTVTMVYHKFDINKAGTVTGDLGNEIDLQYVTSIAERVSAGVKFGRYSANENGSGYVDTNKLWVWMGTTF
ncbi:alginate export family protein [Alteromonas pelagimontana]|uniref:Alginate export family protein n=1 Tax=Alteromonas pelagimontana TaxID=1858656 RepID=A0A6M4MDW4_9ALTE|nr:alginate export family protein [Alteromonas pelagimontana]QJR80336.1 alginate export family protein [Alteromonas pelagimontana]